MRPNLWAIVILVIVVLVLFGAKRLPDVASSIGKSLKIFKKEVKELTEDDPAPRPTPVTHSGSTTAPPPVEPLPGAPARAATPIEHRTT